VGRLTGIDTMLLDLDGTLDVGSQVVPATPEAVRWLRAQGLTVRFTTTTDSIPSRARRPPGPARLPGLRGRAGHPIAIAAQLFAAAPAARALAVAPTGCASCWPAAGPGRASGPPTSGRRSQLQSDLRRAGRRHRWWPCGRRGEPNGLAIDPDGNLVTANIALGRVQRMTRDGQRTTSANFVFYDRRGGCG
jgi:hypothetical protein